MGNMREKYSDTISPNAFVVWIRIIIIIKEDRGSNPHQPCCVNRTTFKLITCFVYSFLDLIINKNFRKKVTDVEIPSKSLNTFF